MKLNFQKRQKTLTILLEGNFLHFDAPAQKNELYALAQNSAVREIVVDACSLGEWDSSLVVILMTLMQTAKARKIAFKTVSLPADLKQLSDLALAVNRHPVHNSNQTEDFLEYIGDWGLRFMASLHRGLVFLGNSFHSVGRFFAGQAVMRSVDLWQALEECGPKALSIVGLISFMVGLILAFVGAIQLKTFGAQVFVASLVTIGMIRIMGAIMVGIIMAGRTGASYAATIGTMQVNEEIDALKTMGIPVSDFLVLPRVVALVITMPLLVLLADFAGMLGGAFVGTALLGIPAEEYWKYAWSAFGLTNFLVGLFHGLVFGFVISLCGCYFGVYCGRNADSVGVATTNAVVWSIVWMIVLTGVITFFCEVIGV